MICLGLTKLHSMNLNWKKPSKKKYAYSHTQIQSQRIKYTHYRIATGWSSFRLWFWMNFWQPQWSFTVWHTNVHAICVYVCVCAGCSRECMSLAPNWNASVPAKIVKQYQNAIHPNNNRPQNNNDTNQNQNVYGIDFGTAILPCIFFLFFSTFCSPSVYFMRLIARFWSYYAFRQPAAFQIRIQDFRRR